MTTEGTTGLNPKTIQRLREEFREHYGELIEANSKGWPACLKAAGGISPRKSVDRESEAKPSPLFFNWTDEALPPAPPAYQQMDKETHTPTANFDKNLSVPKFEENDINDNEEDDDSNYFEDDEEASTSPSSVISHSKRRSYPQPISQVFPQNNSSQIIEENDNSLRIKNNETKNELIAGRKVKDSRSKRTKCPQIKPLIDRYSNTRSLNSYLREHLSDNWKANAKTSDFHDWLEAHDHLWSAFTSGRVEDVCTVFRLYLQQPNKRLQYKKLEANKGNDEAMRDQTMNQQAYNDGFREGKSTDSKDQKGNQSAMFDDLTADSDFRSSQNYHGNDDEDDDDDDARFGEDSSAQVKQRQQQQRVTTSNEHPSLASSSCNSFSSTSSQNENESFSTTSSHQPSKLISLNQKKKDKSKKVMSFMKPTASSTRKETHPKKKLVKNLGKMDTSMRPQLAPIKEQEVSRRSKWAKPQKTKKLSQAKLEAKPLVSPSPVLANARFADGVPRKAKTEHQTNYGWK